MRKYAVLFMIAASSVLSSCWLPPFDEEASLAALTERNLTSRFYITNVKVPKGYQAKFVPVIASKRGAFLFLEGNLQLKASYVTASTAYSPSTNNDISLSFPIKDWDDTVMASVFGSTVAGGTPTVYLFLPDAAAAGSDVDHFYYSYSSGTMAEIAEANSTRLIENVAAAFSLSAADLRLLGFGTLPSESEAEKRIIVLVYSTAAAALYEFELVYDANFTLTTKKNINSSYRGSASQTVLFPAGLDSVAFGRYFFDPVNAKSYFNFKENGSYVTYGWDINNTAAASPLKERIEIVLTSGEVVTRSESLGKVYDGASGACKYSFPLGSLSIAYETYLEGEPNLLFTKPIALDSDGSAYKFFVYSILTEKLGTLKQ